jgi:hypothetical protein
VPSAVRLACRRHRTAVTVAASIAASVALGLLLIGRWDELETGVTGTPIAIAAAAVALQVLALLARSEAWHVCVRAAAAGVLLTATGTVGGLAFAAWGALDMALSRPGVSAPAQRACSSLAQLAGSPHWSHASVGAVSAQLRLCVERACFDLVGYLQVSPMLLPASGAAQPAPLFVDRQTAKSR